LQTPNVLHPMERAGYLINKLKEQFQLQEPPTHLLLTLDLLRKELMGQLQADPENLSLPPELLAFRPVPASRPPDDALYDMDLTRELPTFAHQNFCPLPTTESISDQLSADLTGIPKTTQSPQQEENEDLLASNTPIKDLKRAISARNRFLFIHELFRGDEVMFERSMKTIQGFSIFPEARFWIERELKTKLGWQESSPLVQMFDHLVRRRFS
jgi:hypothetical protein